MEDACASRKALELEGRAGESAMTRSDTEERRIEGNLGETLRLWRKKKRTSKRKREKIKVFCSNSRRIREFCEDLLHYNKMDGMKRIGKIVSCKNGEKNNKKR